MSTPAIGSSNSGSAPSTTTLAISLTVANNFLLGTCLISAATLPTVTAAWVPTSTGVPEAMTNVPLAIQTLATVKRFMTFYILNPTQGAGNVVFTSSLTIVEAHGIISDWSGVNVDTGLTFDTVSVAAGTATSDTVSPLTNTTLDSDLVYAASAVGLFAQAPANSQTEIAELSGAASDVVVGYKTAVGEVTPIGWTFTSSAYVIHAFAIRPAGLACITAEAETYLRSDAATTNNEGNTNLDIGERNDGASINRGWLKPSFTNLPVGVLFSAAAMKLTPTLDLSSNARTMTAARCLRDVVVAQATWNIWKTSNNWGTAGASGAGTDYDNAVSEGTMAIAASPTLNTMLPMTLTAAEFQKLFDGTYTNNGMILFVDTQTNDAIRYAAIEHATPEYRPRFVIQYAAPSSYSGFFF
jgi:hypothetical protein